VARAPVRAQARPPYAVGMALRRDSTLLGKTPPGATHWTVSRKGALTWEACTWRAEAEWTHEFPIADLAVALIRKRWGDGVYRVAFLALSRGKRQSLGAGRVFEVSGAGERTPTPRPAPAPASTDPEDHSGMVHALLRGGEGKRTANELFEALAVPTGMGLSALFSQLERVAERLEGIERRILALEARRPAPPAEPLPQAPLDRVLDKLDAIEQRLAQAAPPTPRAGSRRGQGSPLPR
jgi:hypothetical protein